LIRMILIVRGHINYWIPRWHLNINGFGYSLPVRQGLTSSSAEAGRVPGGFCRYVPVGSNLHRWDRTWGTERSFGQHREDRKDTQVDHSGVVSRHVTLQDSFAVKPCGSLASTAALAADSSSLRTARERTLRIFCLAAMVLNRGHKISTLNDQYTIVCLLATSASSHWAVKSRTRSDRYRAGAGNIHSDTLVVYE
jgi:hypothetical protein